MAEIVARFADGRLLVQEERTVSDVYVRGTGTIFRIGYVRTVEKILSLDTYCSGWPEAKVDAPIAEAKVSGDAILVRLRRADVALSGGVLQVESSTVGILSGITSGLQFGEELLASGSITGKLIILANVIGF